MSVSLLYMRSDKIMEYCEDNPIEWHDSVRDLARRNGVADRAGRPPVLFVEEFLNLYHEHHGLFTQKEYWKHCKGVMGEWFDTKTDDEKTGLMAKVYRNFYPSMIDSLHAWALLVESHFFDKCYLDSADDAAGFTDMTVCRGEFQRQIALRVGTRRAESDYLYKGQCRGARWNECLTIVLPTDDGRPKYPGNKRWYTEDDFAVLVAEMSEAMVAI